MGENFVEILKDLKIIKNPNSQKPEPNGSTPVLQITIF